MEYEGTWAVDEVTGRQILYIGDQPRTVAVTAYHVCSVQYNFVNTDQTNILGHKLLEGQSMVVHAKLIAVAAYNAQPARGSFKCFGEPRRDQPHPGPAASMKATAS